MADGEGKKRVIKAPENSIITRVRAWQKIRQSQKERPESEGPDNPDSDPFSCAAADLHGLHQTSHFVQGIVKDPLAGSSTIKVHLSHLMPEFPCQLASSDPHGIFGMRDGSTLVAGTHVLVYVDELQLPYGIIISTLPSFTPDGRKALSDFIALGSNCGFKADPAHTFPTTLNQGAGIVDWGAHRPFDSTTAGEWTKISDTGNRIFADSWMVQCALNECCGFFAFYFDSLVRMAGTNLQIRAAGYELENLMDQGEVTHFIGYTPYPAEQQGIIGDALGLDVSCKARTAKESQVDEPWYAPREPMYDDQQPFYRSVHHRGYLGQGSKRQIILPPVLDDSSSGILRYCTLNPLPGVFAEDVALTGRYSLRSAKAIHITKRGPIIIPKRVSRPESETGDTLGNYKFGGSGGMEMGQGPSHVVQSQLGSRDNLITAAGVMDIHAYTFNWESYHPFWYHGKDWLLPFAQESFQDLVPFGALAGQQYLSAPHPVPKHVDDRYGKAEYYPNSSGIDLLDDGGVVIYDGYGAELRMTAGQIFLSAPGDIWMKSGRNVNTWAGCDLVMRAKKSIDITATDKDVRLKAEKNMQLLAGNSGTGGLLLESRGAEAYEYYPNVGEDVVSGGVTIKSCEAPAVIYGTNVYVRAGMTDGAYGEIVLDANQGYGGVLINADFVEYFVRTGIWQFFGSQKGEHIGEIVGTNAFLKNFTDFGSGLGVDGGIYASGQIGCTGSLTSVEGHISTSQGGPAGKLIDKTLDIWLKVIDDWTVGAQADMAQSGLEMFNQSFEAVWYEEEANMPGNLEAIKDLGVTLRNGTQYGASKGFKLFDDRWQQMHRLHHDHPEMDPQLAVWKENGVDPSCREEPWPEEVQTYPYPGRKAWKKDKNLCTLAPNYVRAYKGRTDDPRHPPAVIDGPGLYADHTAKFSESGEAAHGTVTNAVLDGHYLIIPCGDESDPETDEPWQTPEGEWPPIPVWDEWPNKADYTTQ